MIPNSKIPKASDKCLRSVGGEQRRDALHWWAEMAPAWGRLGQCAWAADISRRDWLANEIDNPINQRDK